MSEFLELNPTAKFWEIISENKELFTPGRERISYKQARKRILSEDITAPVNLPPFSRATVDGFAVRAADTAGASETQQGYLRVTGEVLMGEPADLVVNPGEAVKIPTGGMLPDGADAVLMVEYTENISEDMIETTRAVASGENVVKKGEDIKAGSLLLKKGHAVRTQDIGALTGLGITEIEVFKKPEVAIISTGDELKPPEADIKPGEIRDINSYVTGSIVEEAGGIPHYIGIIEDVFASLKEAVADSLKYDLVLISGGSSVGVKDMTIDILNSLGEPGVLLHGISIKPGKPTILAVIDDKPVMGLPGHPASSWAISSKIVKPFIRVLAGEKSGPETGKIFQRDLKLEAILNRNLVSDKGREEYVPVKMLIDDEDGRSKYRAEPITGKSSLITTLVEADGFIKIGTYQEGLNRGDRVEVELFN